MKIQINLKTLETITINNALQTSITHVGTREDDDDYNTLQIIYLYNNEKRKRMYKLSQISTCIILEEK